MTAGIEVFLKANAYNWRLRPDRGLLHRPWYVSVWTFVPAEPELHFSILVRLSCFSNLLRPLRSGDISACLMNLIAKPQWDQSPIAVTEFRYHH
jgi:hypothetical protein